MCRKLILLTSFVLVLGFVNNANAQIAWTGLGADNLWSTAANWEGNKVPTAADEVTVDVPGAAAPNGPVIQDGIDAECNLLYCEVAGETTMTMTGGTLTISGWGIWWGDGQDCVATFYMSGGTLSLTGGPGIHEFAWGGASGIWIMTGGTVNAKGVKLTTSSGVKGEIFLHGGTYNIGTERGGLDMSEGNGLIDITEGTLVLEGDETAKINGLIAAGKITAYAGAGIFEMDYDGRNPGSTTVTAVEAGRAYKPNPVDGAIYADTWASLSWSPADDAASHSVYFGDNFDNVNNGTGDTFRGNQVDTFFIVGFPGYPYPDGLVPGTTYYWRIEEVDADGNTIHKGDIWSFRIPPKTAYDPNPADGAEFVDPNVELSWAEGFGAILHTVYFGDNFDDVDNAAGGISQGDTTYRPFFGPLELEKVYYWRVDEYDAIDTYKGDVWSFTTPGAVGNPQPSKGAIDVQMIATLSWTPADNAASHHVYFGTDKDAVRNADTASPEYIGTRNLGLENYDPEKLAWNTTYYWRVDEVYDADPSNPLKGPLWSFTTADFILVDDFESYNDIEETEPGSNIIYDTWIDGWEDPTNGSIVGYLMPPHAEVTIVHGGSQSMPYSYDNDLKYSEATLPLVWPRDWTQEGVGVLSLWFSGDASNAAELMYVALNGSATVYHDNPSAAQIDDWTQWTIDLEEFAAQGVNLTNVNTISIGFGDKNNLQAGGSGKVYFDDIRLYRPKPAERVIFLFDDFEGYADDAGLTAVGWTILDTPTATEDSTWTITNPGGRANPPTLDGSASTGNFMISDSDTQSISGDQDNGASHDLYTPSFSTLGGSTVWLHVDVSAQLNNNGTAIFDVEVSTDGETWTNVFSCVSPGRGTSEPATTRLPDNTNADGYFGRLDLDLSAVAADSAAVQVRFRHYEPDWEWWIAIDNVLVDDVEAPQGGPITVFSEEFSNGLGQMEVFSGQGNTGTETWHTTDKGGRYVPGTVQERGVNRLGPHPGATPDFAIIESDTDPDPAEDEWLMTPTLDLSDMTEVFLHYESETVMSSGVWNQEVLVSLDGGSTFETTPIFAYTGGGLFDNGEEPVFAERIFDVSAIAAGESQVVFAFRYTGDGDDWWWAIDNVEVSGITR